MSSDLDPRSPRQEGVGVGFEPRPLASESHSEQQLRELGSSHLALTTPPRKIFKYLANTLKGKVLFYI